MNTYPKSRFLYFVLHLFIIVFFNTTQNLSAQAKTIDSLELSLKKRLIRDTITINTLNKLAYTYHNKDTSKAMAYIKKAEALSDSLNFEKGKIDGIYTRGRIQTVKSNQDSAIIYINDARKKFQDINNKTGVYKSLAGLAIAYYYKNDYQQAADYAKQSAKGYDSLGDDYNKASCLNILASAYSDLGNYTDAITTYKAAIELGKKLGDKDKLAGYYNNISTIYLDKGDNPHALEYLNKALVLYDKSGNSDYAFKTLNNIAIVYKRQENYENALKYYERALRTTQKIGDKKSTIQILSNIGLVYKSKGDYKKAIEFIEKALEANKQINNKRQIAACLTNLANIYTILKNYPKALKYHQKALKIKQNINYTSGVAHSYAGIADVYYYQKKYQQAVINAQKGLEVANKLGFLEVQRSINGILANIYYETKDYKKAFDNHKEFKILNDSVFNKENIQKLTQLEYKYKYEKELDSAKIQQIKLTKKIKKVDENLATSQRQTLLAIIGVLILGIILGSRIFILRLRNIKSVNQNILIEQKLLQSQMTPHFVFNSLSVLQGIILNNETKKAITYLSKFSRLLRIILENSRDKMIPIGKELLAIKNYIAVQNLGIENPYDYNVEIDKTLNTNNLLIPPMIIQPFIENAIEHAFKKEDVDKQIHLRIRPLKKVLLCEIIDNGLGIDTKTIDVDLEKKSLSTQITIERLQILSKELNTITSFTIKDRKHQNEKGTIVTLKIPHKPL